MSEDQVNRFLKEFVEGAHTQTDIQAVALVSSYARNTATATSDIDLVVITSRPDNYTRDLGVDATIWISQPTPS